MSYAATMRARRWHRAGAPLVALAGLVSLQACAVNNVGFVASEAVPADGAVVVSTYVLGAHLRTAADDRGLSLGFTRRTRIVPLSDAAAAPAAGWRYGHAEPAAANTAALDLHTLGLETRAMAMDTSLTLGLINSTRLANVERGSELAFELHYDALDLASSRYINCMEDVRC